MQTTFSHSPLGLGLKKKAAIYSVIFSVIPVVIIGANTYGMMNQFIRRDITLNKQLQAEGLVSGINQFLLNRQLELELLANQDFLNNDNNKLTQEEKELRLKNWLEKEKFYNSLVVLDLQGNVKLKTSSQATTPAKNADYLPKIRQSGSFTISQPVLDHNRQNSRIYLNVPVKDRVTGEVIRVIRGEISSQKLLSGTSQKRLSQYLDDRKYYLLDQSGLVFLSNDSNQQGKPIGEIFAEWDRLNNSPHIITETLPIVGNQKQALVTVVPMVTPADLGWRLVLSQDSNTAFAVPRNLLRNLFISSILTILLAVIIAVILARRLSSRLITANMAVTSLAQGNLDTRMPLAGGDELTSLGANINEMAAQLQRLIRERSQETEQLKQFSQALLTIQQTTTREELFKTITQEMMTALGVERVTIYACNPDGSYTAIAESVVSGVKSLQQFPVSQDIIDNTRVLVVGDVNVADYSNDLRQQLQKMQVKSRVITPIVEDKQATDGKRNRYRISALGVVPVAIAVDMCTRQRDWSSQEIDFIRQSAAQLGVALERIDSQAATQALKNLAVHLSGSWQSDDIYSLAVQDIRQALQVDRVVIYQFDPSYRGKFLAESVVAGFPCAMGFKLTDTCLEEYVEKYRRGRVVAINDIYDAGLSQCYIQQLETFAVKANLVAPIIVGDELLGLLIAHQCSQGRIWQIGEIDLFEQFARMVGLALERANLLQNTMTARDIAESIAQQRSEETERMQTEILTLIDSIEKAIAGDLTVRAEVGVGEIGTIADFFNAIIESLRILVINVKNTATQVNQAINDNAIAIKNVALGACEQATDTRKILETITAMRAKVKTTSETIAGMAQITSAIMQIARENDGKLQQAIAEIGNLGEELEQNRHQTENLSESVQQIQRLINGINQSAMQTNLLAINTGIEVNRSGENNPANFPILLQEIANLANRCTHVTHEIDTIVQNMHQDSSILKGMMESGINQVNQSSKNIEISQTNLQQILQICQQVDELMQSIATSIVETEQYSHQVSQKIHSMVEVSGNTSTTAQEIAEALEQTVQLSEELQHNICNFQVD